jgi:hypothetical protein
MEIVGWLSEIIAMILRAMGLFGPTSLLGKPRDVAQRLVLASVFAVRQNRERLTSM